MYEIQERSSLRLLRLTTPLHVECGFCELEEDWELRTVASLRGLLPEVGGMLRLWPHASSLQQAGDTGGRKGLVRRRRNA